MKPDSAGRRGTLMGANAVVLAFLLALALLQAALAKELCTTPWREHLPCDSLNVAVPFPPPREAEVNRLRRGDGSLGGGSGDHAVRMVPWGHAPYPGA